MNKTITKTEKLLSKHKTATLIGTNKTTTNYTSITTTTPYPSELNMTTSTKAQTLEIPIAIEIETDEVLFDAAIDILPLKKTISAGEGLPAQITLFSVGSPRKVDVLLNYIIKDSNGNTISEESETMAVEGQKSFMKEFFIPGDAQTGNYIITLEVIYATTVATASQMFSLIPPPPGKITAATKNTQILSILALALILSTIGTAIILKGRKFYNN